MLKKLSLVALTTLITGGGALAMTGAPAAADGLSINVGVPGVYANYDDYRYHNDGGDRDRHRRDDHRDRHRDDRHR